MARDIHPPPNQVLQSSQSCALCCCLCGVFVVATPVRRCWVGGGPRAGRRGCAKCANEYTEKKIECIFSVFPVIYDLDWACTCCCCGGGCGAGCISRATVTANRRSSAIRGFLFGSGLAAAGRSFFHSEVPCFSDRRRRRSASTRPHVVRSGAAPNCPPAFHLRTSPSAVSPLDVAAAAVAAARSASAPSRESPPPCCSG